MKEYERRDASFYDYYSTGLEGDVEFYVEEAQKAGSPVLELGCGTGRIAIPIANAGVSIVGLDRSTAMLAKAEEKLAQLPDDVQSRLTLKEGDMRNFSFAQKFNLIMIPYRAFLHLLTVNDQKAALNNIRQHLAEDGLLVFNIFDPKLELLVTDNDQLGVHLRKGPDFYHPKLGHNIITWLTCQYDLETQILESYNIFEEIDDDGALISKTYVTLVLRYIFRYEMEHLLNLCGFDVVNLFGDFDRTPFKAGAEQIWIARKSD